MTDTPPALGQHRSAASWLSGPLGWATLVVPVLVLMPFVVLTGLAFPQVDDFCFAAEWRDHGLVDMLILAYRTFVGRIFANTFIVIPFMVADALGADVVAVYRIEAALVLLAVMGAAAAVSAMLFRGLRLAAVVFLAGYLACVLIAGAPAPGDLFYWMSQAANYTLAALVALVAMVWLFRRAERGKPISPLAVAVLSVLGFVTATASEMSGAIMFAIVAGALVRRRLTSRAPGATPAHRTILVAVAAATLIVAAAPGNAVRMDAYDRPHGIMVNAAIAVPMALLDLLRHLGLELMSPPLLMWPALVALATWHLDGRPGASPAARVPSLAPWVPVLTALAATYAGLWIGRFGLGHPLPPRALNHLHVVLVAGLTLTVMAVTRAHGERIRRWAAVRAPRLTGRWLIAAAILAIAAAPNTVGATRTALVEAPALAPAIDERFARWRSGDADVVVPPLSVRGWPVVVRFPHPTVPGAGEMTADPRNWVNECIARYFALRSTRLAGSPPR